MIIYTLLILLLVSHVCLNVVLVVIRNYRSRETFKKRASWLPIVPGSTLLAGHLRNVIVQNKNWKIMDGLHEKYGKSYGLFMAGENWIATKDIGLIKHVILDQGRRHINRCDLFCPLKEVNDSLLQSRDDDWRRNRRLIASTLNNRKVCSDEVSNDIRKLVNQLDYSLKMKLKAAEEKSGKRSLLVDVDDVFRRFCLGIFFLVNYKMDNMVRFDTNQDTLVKQMNEICLCDDSLLQLVPIGIMFPFIRSTVTFLSKFHKLSKYFRDLSSRILDMKELDRKASIQFDGEKMMEKECSGQSTGDTDIRMIDLLVNGYLNKRISRDHLIGNLVEMPIAGYTTVADALTSLMWRLAIHPEIQEKLRQSIIEDGIEAEYLAWCIHETVRLHPPVPLGTGRVLKEDVVYEGRLYPAGAFVTPTILTVHTDESIWPEAKVFKPDRWKDRSRFHPAAFLGFGLGQRNCPGSKLAIQQMKVATQMLLTNYRFEECEETVEDIDFSSPLLILTKLEQPIKLKLVAIE